MIAAIGPVWTRRPSRRTVTVIAQPEDLVEAVRDVDDRHTVAPEDVDDLEQSLDLARLERRGGLVHDHDAVFG